MVQSAEGQSSETNADATRSDSEPNGFERFIEVFIQQIEMVARHFNYTEEYVLSHSPAWLTRKTKQAQREQFEDHQAKVLSGYQSALLVLDSVFNKGKEFNEILPPSLDAVMQRNKLKQEIESNYVAGVWWGRN